MGDGVGKGEGGERGEGKRGVRRGGGEDGVVALQGSVWGGEGGW